MKKTALDNANILRRKVDMSEENIGCSDNNCWLQDNNIGTNGGCNCLRELSFKINVRIKKRISQLKAKIKELKAENERLKKKTDLIKELSDKIDKFMIKNNHKNIDEIEDLNNALIVDDLVQVLIKFNSVCD